MMDIGGNIKRFRLQQAMTQQDVAVICGLTKGMISKIESGKVTPALATLTKIADAVGVDIIALMSEKQQRTAAFTPAAQGEDGFVLTDLGYRIFGLARKYFNKQMQPVLIVAKKESTLRHLVSHDDEELIYMLSGIMIFMADERLYTLKSGDSLYFDGSYEHGIYEVVEDATYLDVFIGSRYEGKASHGLRYASGIAELENRHKGHNTDFTDNHIKGV